MTELENEIADAEAAWGMTDKLVRDDKVGTTTATVFDERVLPIAAVRNRRQELGVENAALCTREQRPAMAAVNGLCRKINGEVERLRKLLVEDAVSRQRIVNGRAKEIKEEVAEIQRPILARFAEWDAEDAAAAQAKIQDELAFQAEANRLETERLAVERAQLEADRLELETARRATQKIEDDRQAAETARALEEAQRFNDQQAAEKARIRQEAIEPDVPKLRRFAAALNLTRATAPEMTSDEAKELCRWACEHVARVASALIDFGSPQPE